jgi:hypothetical protein
VAAAKKDKRSSELAKFHKAWADLGSPPGNGAEQTIRALLARNGTRDGADKACDQLWKRYIDVNEFRVAKPLEVAELVDPFVKNDPEDVAHHLRGFLRLYFKERNTLDFTDVSTLTPEQLRKFLDALEYFKREIGLAIFFSLLIAENEEDALLETEDGESKPKKRTEREGMLAVERIRMACAFAAFGESPTKAKLSTAHRKLAEAYKFGPVPALPPPPEPATIPQIVVPDNIAPKVALQVVSASKKAAKKVAKKVAAKKVAKKAAKKVAAKKVAKKAAKQAAKKVAKKASKKAAKKAAKKSAKKTSASRTGGGARPRTTRTTRTPSATKKSSRR